MIDALRMLAALAAGWLFGAWLMGGNPLSLLGALLASGLCAGTIYFEQNHG